MTAHRGEVWAAGGTGLTTVVMSARLRRGRLAGSREPCGAFETFEVGAGPTGIALGAGSVWTADSVDGTVTRIDLRSGTTTTIRVGGTPNDLVMADGLIWVTVT